MSKYVNKMKDVLTSFQAAAAEIRAKVDFAEQNYNADYAAEERNKLQAQLNQAAESARAQIDAINAEAGEAARKWAALDGENVDHADLDLLKGGFDLTGDDVHELLVKHQGNGTMVRAIAKYAKEHDITPEYIPNLADKLMAYSAFCASAHSVISDISNSIGQTAGNFSRWAEPGNISQRMELVLYGIKSHTAGDVAKPREKFDFNFKPLSGR